MHPVAPTLPTLPREGTYPCYPGVPTHQGPLWHLWRSCSHEPAPSRAEPLILLGAGFILIGIAVLAYSLGAASGAKKPLAALKSRVTARRKPVVPFQDDSLGAGPGAAGAGGADETTPLLPDGAGGTAVRRVPSRNATRPGAAWFLRSASAARMAPPQDPAGGVTQQL